MKVGEGWRTLYAIDTAFSKAWKLEELRRNKIASFAEIQKGKWCKW